jgi:hemerythrin-like domain-containing protein
MNSLEKLQEEHQKIERELIEIETIIDDDEINYSNLVHVLNNLFPLWKEHEEKEEKVFSIFEEENIKIPVKKMLFEHGRLRIFRESIIKAINSGNNERIRAALKSAGVSIISDLRAHMNAEDEVLYTLALSQLTKEEISRIERILKT